MAAKGKPQSPRGATKDLKIKRERAQARALSLIAQGMTVEETMAAVGRAKRTHQVWRERFPWYAAQVDAIRHNVTAGELPAFPAFRRAMFGFDTYWHQQQMIDAIEGAKGGEITMILLPPEWMKTTTLEDWICYILGAVEPDHRFAVISEGQYQARKIIGRLQRRMTDESSAFFQRYGPFKSEGREEQKPWSADRFTIVRAGMDERDYSVEARGAGSKVYGSRWDTVILDDIQSTQNLNATTNLLEFIRQDVLTRPGKEGRIVIIGTRVGPGDIYERMLEEGMVDNLVRIPARDEEGHSMFPAVFDEKGERVLYGRNPLGWSEEELAAREEYVGPEIWARVYMQQPASKAGAPFTEDSIERSLDQDRAIGDRNPGMGIMCSLDPATAGFASYKVCGYDAEHLYLLDTVNLQAPGRFEELFDALEELVKKWHPGEVIIEANAIQGGIARDDRLREMSERYGFRIVEHTSGRNKVDEKIGVASMADSFRRREVRIPYGDEPSRRQVAQLIKELRAWRPDIPTKMLRQDEVMALWFCYLRWQKIRDTLQTSTRELKIGGMGWAPTPYGSRVA